MKHATFYMLMFFAKWMNSMKYYKADVITNKMSEITVRGSIDFIWLEIFENTCFQRIINSNLKKLNCMK